MGKYGLNNYEEEKKKEKWMINKKEINEKRD